jgi:hypothetical protein
METTIEGQVPTVTVSHNHSFVPASGRIELSSYAFGRWANDYFRYATEFGLGHFSPWANRRSRTSLDRLAFIACRSPKPQG